MKRIPTPPFAVIAGALLAGAVAMQFVLAAPAKPAAKPETPQAKRRIVAEGRVVGRVGSDATIGSEVPGLVDEVLVVVNQSVRAGDVIARLRADDVRAAIAEAEAKVAEAESAVRLYESEAARAKQLWESEVGTRQQYDRAIRDIEAAQTQRRTASASLDRLRAAFRKTEIRAPFAGVVVERSVDPGEAVDVGDPVATIVDPARTRIEAEVDEFDVARIVDRAPVRITADGFDGLSWNGRVEEIPLRVVGRSIRPVDPAQAVDTRVLVVGVELLETTPLKIGQRVEVEIGQ
ncbi:MAG: efflux RND transporter periplasmic adaptor subunit [Thermoanaerobaculia bacterium]